MSARARARARLRARSRVSAIRGTHRTRASEGKRRVPFVRTRACAARLAAVTYIRARAYNLFLAGVSQPPDALFGTTRCHAPVPPPRGPRGPPPPSSSSFSHYPSLRSTRGISSPSTRSILFSFLCFSYCALLIRSFGSSVNVTNTYESRIRLVCA